MLSRELPELGNSFAREKVANMLYRWSRTIDPRLNSCQGIQGKVFIYTPLVICPLRRWRSGTYWRWLPTIGLIFWPYLGALKVCISFITMIYSFVNSSDFQVLRSGFIITNLTWNAWKRILGREVTGSLGMDNPFVNSLDGNTWGYWSRMTRLRYYLHWKIRLRVLPFSLTRTSIMSKFWEWRILSDMLRLTNLEYY